MIVFINGHIDQEIVDEVMRWSVTPEMQQVKAHVSVPRPNPDGTYPENAFIRITGFFREPGEIEIEIPPKLIRAQQEDKINIDIGGTAVEPIEASEDSAGICIHNKPRIIRTTDKYIVFSCKGPGGEGEHLWGYFYCEAGHCRLFRHALAVEDNKIKYKCTELFNGSFTNFRKKFPALAYDILMVWTGKIIFSRYK